MAISLILASIAIAWTLSGRAYQRVGQPFPGFFLHQHNSVGLLTTPSSTRFLGPLDRIVEMNGQPVEDTESILGVVRSKHRPGDVMRYRVITTSGEEQLIEGSVRLFS